MAELTEKLIEGRTNGQWPLRLAFGRRSAGRQLLVFLVVGGAAALGFVVLSSVLISLHTGLEDWLVSAACYAAFVLPTYLAHRRLSFDSHAPHRQALPRYVGVQLFGVALASVFSFVVYGRLALPAFVSSVIVIGLTAGVNFMALRLWAFAAPN